MHGGADLTESLTGGEADAPEEAGQERPGAPPDKTTACYPFTADGGTRNQTQTGRETAKLTDRNEGSGARRKPGALFEQAAAILPPLPLTD